MSRSYLSDSIKNQVILRANECCEYCLKSNLVAYISHQIDHIINLKHGGNNNIDNLSYACYFCNVNKGSDIGTMLLPERTFIRLYNPRTDNWNDHFEIFEGKFYPKTPIAEATIKILQLNEIERIMERQ